VTLAFPSLGFNQGDLPGLVKQMCQAKNFPVPDKKKEFSSELSAITDEVMLNVLEQCHNDLPKQILLEELAQCKLMDPANIDIGTHLRLLFEYKGNNKYWLKIRPELALESVRAIFFFVLLVRFLRLSCIHA
jgi:hypothetical protein